MKIEFADAPPVGLALAVNGQRFDLISIDDHTTAAGNNAKLLTWSADCAECGNRFSARTSATRLPDIRRCELHRRPGKRVRGQ